MRYILVGFIFLFFGGDTVSASELSVTEVARPYDIVEIAGDPSIGHTYLGELDNFPIMYAVTTEEPFSLNIQMKQVHSGSPEPIPFSLIVIRQNDDGKGVTEVARLKPAEDWSVTKDSVYGMKFWESEKFAVPVEPGAYRIEISTPENLGRYILTFGEGGEQSGYFATLGNIRTTQKFFGFSFLKMLTSSYVYYPIGIFLLLFAIQRTWKYRQSIAHVD